MEYSNQVANLGAIGIVAWLLSVAAQENNVKEISENFLLKGTPFMNWYFERANNVLELEELNKLKATIGL